MSNFPYNSNNFNNNIFLNNSTYTTNTLKNPNYNTKKETENFFQFLGFKVTLEDLLIMALLYFLYVENIEDNTLFIILSLLLVG